MLIILMSLFLIACDDNLTLPTDIQTTNTQTTDTQTTNTSDIVMALNPGIDTIEVYSDFIDAGAVATYGDESITVTVVDNTVDTDHVGVYFVRYQATYGQEASMLIRIVIVIDSTKPDIQLEKGIDTIILNEEWIDAGVIATDNYDDELDISIQGSVDTTSIGTYTIIYTATDDYGNSSSMTRIVDVIE
jgi:hypothetical protein